MQPDLPEAVWLVALVSSKVQAYPVGGVVVFRVDFFGGGEANVRISLVEEVDDVLCHAARQTACVFFQKTSCIRHPSDQIAQCSYRVADQNVYIVQIKGVGKTRFVFSLFPDAQGKVHRVFFGAEDQPSFAGTVEEDVAGVGIGDARFPLAGRQKQSGSVVEVVTDAEGAFLGRSLGWLNAVGAAIRGALGLFI